ncbi:hypothetical protein [Paenibacillus sp. NRS-1760]|uniref:hypothetical protein n=1 Tax=Paenibacillus sp. NRS-1760 TaxID=3233902 RepID=UPI003D2CAC06
MTFRKRMLVLSIIDSLLLLGSWMFALYLIYGELLPQSLSVTDVAVAGLFIITSYFFLVISKSYKTLWKYAGVHELIRVFKAVAAAVILYAAELLLFMREIDDCVKKAHESNRLRLPSSDQPRGITTRRLSLDLPENRRLL